MSLVEMAWIKFGFGSALGRRDFRATLFWEGSTSAATLSLSCELGVCFASRDEAGRSGFATG